MSHDDFKFEPVRGLPEALPEGEHILWQGSPAPLRLARDALGLTWVAGYFAVLTVWRVGVSSTYVPFGEALAHGIPFLVVGMLACLLIFGLAYMQARSAVYTLTNKRVGMRIGAALTMTLNLPYTQIGNAGLDTKKSGHGTLAFELIGDTRFSYMMTWPHVRPWHMSKTQPAFRSIPDAHKVAAIFAEAAEARVFEPKVERASHANAVAAE
ncbi:PH domain-containing protein [Octadecabacter sp. G9-8]|uniref:PH domain-containing protein n=1 Tax=Octadecabacter dasysiphoniae TaxID=2909341 RepID=A0ABS9CWB2_9RHOB|nr:photosynthetic complex putative assembly protein PuhB [Octadecabacter dasysiphoniae]MCF2871566.1 PH domain-containing protein [Octadecabacter dasysiphoniae]